MIQQQPQPSNPLERVTQQYEFSLSKQRDMVAVSVTDLAYLLRQLQPEGYKDQTSP